MGQEKRHRLYDHVLQSRMNDSNVADRFEKYFADQRGQPFFLCKFQTNAV